nr:MAG TPA: protein of unknown function (DUF5325) [Caudoviricetes sp.]
MEESDVIFLFLAILVTPSIYFIIIIINQKYIIV